MKQVQKRGSRWRSAQWGEQGWVQRAGWRSYLIGHRAVVPNLTAKSRRSTVPDRRVASLAPPFAGTRGASLPRNVQKKAPPLETSCGVLATSYSRTAYRRTTIGAAAFHCRVRNGNGWGHCVIVTRNLGRLCRRKFLVRDWRSVKSLLRRGVSSLETFVTLLTSSSFYVILSTNMLVCCY